MRRPLLLTILLSAFLAAGCSRGTRDEFYTAPPPAPLPSLVSMEIEVYDPVTEFVWENVGVRIVEAYNEWSGLTRINPLPDDWLFTDANGLVFFDEFEVALADVGFIEDSRQRAVLEPFFDSDEAIVTLEVWSPGFAPAFVDVQLSWDRPDVFVAVPFD